MPHLSDINLVDQQGNTPLHRAILGEHCNSINLLLNHGADSSVLNNDQMAPIHLAVEVNAVQSLKVWSVDLNMDLKLSSSMTNQQNDLCGQRRLRSAWASAQSDQSLRCPHVRTGHFVGFVVLRLILSQSMQRETTKRSLGSITIKDRTAPRRRVEKAHEIMVLIT